MNKHTCEWSLEVENKFPFVVIRPLTLKNVWIAWCGISKYTPKCNLYMDSTVTVFIERRRHVKLKCWWVIHPFSYARFLWDTIMIAIYLVAFFTIPFMICFVIMDYELISLDKVNISIYAICWLDIALNCITGYHDKKETSIELKPIKIFVSYLKGFLILDILSSLPYDHMTLPWRRLPGNNPHYIVILINIMPLVKLTRFYTLISNISCLFTHFKIKNFYFELNTTLLLGLYLIFWFSCLCYLIPILIMYFANIPPMECDDCWMIRLEYSTLKYKFKNAVFIVLQDILASGYGLLIPQADGLIILNSILMIVGRFILCYMLIIFFRFEAERKISESKFQELIDEIKAYTRQKQLPSHMKKRLIAYYHYRFKSTYFRDKRILSNLTEPLREEIAFQSCRRLIENVAIFKTLPTNALQSIIKNLKYELYLPNAVIIKAGSHGDCMFFLSSGVVAVLTPTGKEMCHLSEGDYFGEVALLVADQRRVASVIAIEVCEVYRLDRKDFRQCIKVHSELFAEIERIATERIERTIKIEEQHKRFLMQPGRVPNLHNRSTKII